VSTSVTDDCKRPYDDTRLQFEPFELKVFEKGIELFPHPPLLFRGNKCDDDVAFPYLRSGSVESREDFSDVFLLVIHDDLIYAHGFNFLYGLEFFVDLREATLVTQLAATSAPACSGCECDSPSTRCNAAITITGLLPVKDYWQDDCPDGQYKNSSLHCVPRPNHDPSTATAICNDGTFFSFGASLLRTCSHHGGVRKRLVQC
jgi:hypothetical protein